jgi:hypothetical protein
MKHFFGNEIYQAVDEYKEIVSNRAQPRQPFGIAHGDIEYIPMKNPGLFVILQRQYHLINDLERPKLKAGKAPERLIVIAGDIVYPDALPDKLHNVFNNPDMAFRKEVFVELPDIDDVSVQYKRAGPDAFKILQQLLRTASICAQMYV